MFKWQFLLLRRHGTSQLQLPAQCCLGEIISVYSENHTNPTNTIVGQSFFNAKAGGTYNNIGVNFEFVVEYVDSRM
jgi:hypothetical protein